MAFHDKRFWMGKGNNHITDSDTLFDNSSRVDSKRSHHWFSDTTETELLPHKGQAIESPNSKSISEIPTSHLSWDNDNVSALQSSPNQFIDRLLGSPVRMDNRHETCVNYGGIRKVKVNQVKVTDSSVNASNDNNFITMGTNYDNENRNVTLMGHSFNGFDPIHRETGPTEGKDEDNSIVNAISFSGFQDESEIDPLGRQMNGYFVKSMNNYGLSFDQSPGIKELDVSNTIVVGNPIQGMKSKSKLDKKPAKKEAPNSFPSNVRSLMATGILDGVPVKYVSPSREELQGIIKGSGYLCSCQSCNHSKALNAYEFERHAGCKTKHPNSYIYFDSGKTIYQIVQELRSTPESLLFDAIQTVTGSPINQKAFRSWRESFQAATRELERIYRKDELNI